MGNGPGNDSERLTPIILHRKHPDHMQMRQTLRMPVFVAKKSQYRNCQWQEWVAISHGCAGSGEAEISIFGIMVERIGPTAQAFFKSN